jgi:hypothetical protein
MALIGCPEMSVQNYHSLLREVSLKRAHISSNTNLSCDGEYSDYGLSSYFRTLSFVHICAPKSIFYAGA